MGRFFFFCGAHRLQVEASVCHRSDGVFSLDDKGGKGKKKKALVFFHLSVTSLRAQRNPRCHSGRERERNCN